MASLFRTSLQDVQKRAEQLSKQVEKYQAEHKTLEETSSDGESKELLNFRKRVHDLKKQCTQLVQKAENLKTDAKIPNFDEKKLYEVERLREYVVQLEALSTEQRQATTTDEGEETAASDEGVSKTNEETSAADDPESEASKPPLVSAESEDITSSAATEHASVVERTEYEQIKTPDPPVIVEPKSGDDENTVTKPLAKQSVDDRSSSITEGDKPYDNVPSSDTESKPSKDHTPVAKTEGKEATVTKTHTPIKKQEDEESEEDEDEEESDEDEQEEEEITEKQPLAPSQSTAAPISSDIRRMSVSLTSEQLATFQFEAMSDLTAAQPGDLTLEKGDILLILATRSDGWWTAQNERDESGLVPKTYLQVHSKYESISSADDEDEEESGDDGEQVEPSTETAAEPTVDEPPFERVTVQPLYDDSNVSPAPIGEAQPRRQSMRRSAVEVLRSVGAIPVGVVASKLALMQREDPHLSLFCHLVPRLSESNLEFHDLYWNPDNEKLRKRRIRVSRCLRLVKATGLPAFLDDGGRALGDFTVESRHFRLCLYDGAQVVSNVHTIRAQSQPNRPNSWIFSPKVVAGDSCVDHAEFFVRSNYAQKQVVLLLEAAIAFHQPSTGERGELTCGWAILPLLKVDVTSGNVNQPPDNVINKTYNLLLRHGSPLDPDNQNAIRAAAAEAAGSPTKTMLAGNDQAAIELKILAPTVAVIEQLDALPDILIWDTQFISMAYWYRRLAAEVLVRNRDDAQYAGLISNTFLALFPKVADQPDIMDVVRRCWTQFEKGIRKDQRKSEAEMAEMFRKVFVDTGGAVYGTAALPVYDLGNTNSLKTRDGVLSKFVEVYTVEQSPVSWLAGSAGSYKPLDIFDVSVDLMGLHAID